MSIPPIKQLPEMFSGSNNNNIRYMSIAPSGGIAAADNHKDRQRARRACDECRRKKIKCQAAENGRTCKNCIATAKGCTFKTGTKKRGPRRGYISLLEGRLKRLEGLLDDFSAEKSGENSSPTQGNVSQEPEPATLEQPQSEKPEEKEPFNKNLTLILENMHKTGMYRDGWFIRHLNASVLYSSKKFHDAIEEDVLKKLNMDVFHQEGSDYIYMKRMQSPESYRKEQIEHLFRQGFIKHVDMIQNINDWIIHTTGISRELSDRLLKVYFAHIHPILPIINKTEFLQEYRGIRHCYPNAPLLNSMYGAAARYVNICIENNDWERLDGSPWSLPRNFVERRFQNMINYLKKGWEPRLSHIQAILIAHNHSGKFENWSNAWVLNCVAVRMSQDLGLNRSSDGYAITEKEKQTRRLAWAAAYILDRWSSATTGRPFTAYDEDCDEVHPSDSVNLDEAMDVMTEHDQHLPRFPSLSVQVAEKFHATSVPLNQPFVQLLKLSEILGQILQGLYTPRAKQHSAQYGSDAMVAYLDDALSKWRAGLPPLLSVYLTGDVVDTSTKEYYPILCMSGLLTISYYTLLILLHRPFIEKDAGGPSNISSQSSLAICTSAANHITKISEGMTYRDFLAISVGFVAYPVFTAALIHIHNCSNPNPALSSLSKSSLKRTLITFNRIANLSSVSVHTTHILKKVIGMSPIFADHPELAEILDNKHVPDETREGGEKASSSSMNYTPSSVPVSVWSQDWINQLQPNGGNKDEFLSPQSSSTPLNYMNAYTIRQFGLGTHQLQQTVPLDQQRGGETAPPLPPPPALFEFSDFSSPYCYGYSMMNYSNNAVSDNNNDLSAMFRHQPDNPFWDIPSGMEMEDWQAILSAKE